MDHTGKNNDNGITPMYVLLPFYTEFKIDVFLDILKLVVARTRLGEQYIDHAFISGMAAKTLFIKSRDLSPNCSEESSMSQQIRICNLLGFWAVNNFPSLGKKLLGERWQAPEDRTVTIGSQQDLLKEDKQMDAIIFPKFKLRVIELCVSNSTIAKVKHFVTVPASVCEINHLQISKKMKMFDIQDAYIENCWQALKLGKYSMNAGFEQRIEIERREIEQDRSENTGRLVSTAKRARMDMALNVDITNSDSAIGSQLVSTAEQVRVDMYVNTANRDSAIDNLRAAIQNMTNDISKLTKWFDPEAELASSFKVVEVNKQMIAELENNLTESNQKKLELVGVVEANKQMIAELEKNLTGSNGVVEANKQTIAELEKNLTGSNQKELELVGVVEANKQKIAELEKNLTGSNQKELELVGVVEANKQTIAQLENNFTESNQKKLELVGVVEANKQTIAQLESNLIESNQKKMELVGENEMLQEQLEELKRNLIESDQKNMEIAGENQKLFLQINELKDHFQIMVPALKQQIESLEKSIDKSSANGASEAEDTGNEMSSSEKSNEKLHEPALATEQIGDSNQKPIFQTDDPIVIACRDKLLKLKFGWIKFYKSKKSKFSPGFLHPEDDDGKCALKKLLQTDTSPIQRTNSFNSKRTLNPTKRIEQKFQH